MPSVLLIQVYLLLHSIMNHLLFPDYEATQDDILRARVPTIGVRETQFTVKNNLFIMVDVGGQRSERRKWLHCFQDVNSVIYLAALDEYDKTLEEDRRTNRMLESLNLYEQLSGLKWFTDTPFILFLNKYFSLMSTLSRH